MRTIKILSVILKERKRVKYFLYTVLFYEVGNHELRKMTEQMKGRKIENQMKENNKCVPISFL